MNGLRHVHLWTHRYINYFLNKKIT
uniref:Uncharacterized protein n=1 Tax=Rhizophora mucronata TaxID=61149 RepID=A0A2P2R4R6_RHIMU